MLLVIKVRCVALVSVCLDWEQQKIPTVALQTAQEGTSVYRSSWASGTSPVEDSTIQPYFYRRSPPSGRPEELMLHV